MLVIRWNLACILSSKAFNSTTLFKMTTDHDMNHYLIYLLSFSQRRETASTLRHRLNACMDKVCAERIPLLVTQKTAKMW
ncbi:MAG: hypothetical protein M2R45_00698 [Verrucomicrobia subdivision 3 bacterium]|nr:hypothetical protein [Limisphaerales bacterium]MCS1414418.1 hypothetical protein [Limisphaerales bacterium]